MGILVFKGLNVRAFSGLASSFFFKGSLRPNICIIWVNIGRKEYIPLQLPGPLWYQNRCSNSDFIFGLSIPLMR